MTATAQTLNPITKVAIAVFLVVATYTVPFPWGAGAALIAVSALAIATGSARRIAMLAAAVAIPTWLLLAIMNGIVAPQGATMQVFGVPVAADALRAAAAVAVRLGAAVAALGWMVVTTSPQRLVRSLAQKGFPAWAQYVLAASLAAVPDARRRAREVLEAQQCRGLAVSGGFLSRTRAMIPLVGPLMVGLVAESERRAIALEARAFHPRGRRTSLVDVPDPRLERSIRLVLWVAAALLVIRGMVR